MQHSRRIARLALPVLPLFYISVFLYSCSDDSAEKTPQTPPTTTPANPIPDTPDPNTDIKELDACTPKVSYGYTDQVSYMPSEKVTVYLHTATPTTACRLNVYSVTEDSVFSVKSSLTTQTITTSDPSIDGFGFSPTVEMEIPSSVPSGLYMIENKIPFIVKPKGPVDLLIVYPSNTANAYEQSGGKSLYTSNKGPMVSFHRPIALQPFSKICLQWFYNQKDVSIGYIADVDLDEYENISEAKILVIVGHNEYWTRKARENFDAFIDNGHDALILSGNTMWWQVRYSDDKSQLICYKSDSDPVATTSLKTILWNNPSLDYPIISSIGADFDLGGYGLKSDLGWNGYKIMKPASPLFEGTGLQKGDIISLPTTECDGAPLAGFDIDNYPILDRERLQADQAEIIAFDRGFRNADTYPTMLVYRRSKSSGTIINTGTTDWCSSNGMGGASGTTIKKITANAIHKLLNRQSVFIQ
ncbi:MAG TPA: N,N-dimethylformamidase beta subunit family domain-containing protein [Ohtaekwangia sp.]|uniref:N,N-dimethylformamidase beta subunit family domain-containing protein n=1 Tax=Ohtaekwangia sp. TaxID=2066019 RepID=UPI002F936A23